MADYGSASPSLIASGYPDLSGVSVCMDNMGILRNIDCKTVFGTMVMGKSKERLLPDVDSCNRPKVWYTIGTPNVMNLEVNGPLQAQTATVCRKEYRLGGFEYIRMKRDMLDGKIACESDMINSAVEERTMVALAEYKDARISCGLPALACSSTQGNNAGESGIALGTPSAPVRLSKKIDAPAGTTYVLDYMQRGAQVIEEMGIGQDMISVVGPLALKFAIRQSETFLRADLSGKESAYTNKSYCGDISLACDMNVYASNCQPLAFRLQGFRLG